MNARARVSVTLVVLLCSSLVAACQGPLGKGVDEFREARYPDAAVSLRRVDVAKLDSSERARYELYSGLNHLALGNAAWAVTHLTTARNLILEDPKRLTPKERGQLESAWRSLGAMPGAPLTPEPAVSPPTQ